MKVTIELAKIWSWIKSYWYVPLGFVIFGVLWYLTKSSDLSPWEMLQKARDNHRRQVEDIEKINKEKDEKIAAEEKKLKAQLEVIEKKANEEMKNLDDDKKARVEQLLKKNKDNPAALAKRLSELTGLSFNQNDVE
tara:strand:- start:158 stop:565 length:408 start_codon:yes stop_codon:yes gene_type:complete